MHSKTQQCWARSSPWARRYNTTVPRVTHCWATRSASAKPMARGAERRPPVNVSDASLHETRQLLMQLIFLQMWIVVHCQNLNSDRYICLRNAPVIAWWPRTAAMRITRWLATRIALAYRMAGVASSRNAWSTGVPIRWALPAAMYTLPISGRAPRPRMSANQAMCLWAKR